MSVPKQRPLPENASYLAFWFDEESGEIKIQLPGKQEWMSYAQFARLGHACFKLAADFKYWSGSDEYINAEIHEVTLHPLDPDEEVK